MNRYCEDCRHWTRRESRRPTTLTPIGRGMRRISEPVPVAEVRDEPWGECQRPGTADARVRLRGGLNAETGPSLETRRDFSCQQWQSR